MKTLVMKMFYWNQTYSYVIAHQCSINLLDDVARASTTLSLSCYSPHKYTWKRSNNNIYCILFKGHQERANILYSTAQGSDVRIRKGWFSNTSFATGLKTLPTFRPDALVFFRAKMSKRQQGFQPCCEAGIREPTLPDT